MKKLLFFFLLSTFSLSSSAQRLWEYGFALGVSNYLGDIGGKEKTRRDFVSDMKLSKTRWNTGGFVRYKWRPKVSLKLAFDYLRIEGDDKLSSNPARNARNLNFRNDIFDLAFTGQVFFYEDNDLGNTYRYKNGFRAYFFGGLGAYYHNPKALYNDEWVKLRPLKTEGVSYSPIGLNIPVGIGCYFTFEKKHRIGFELNWRTTFTDYLDDISADYIDTRGLDPTTAALSNRTPELSGLDPKFARNFGFDYGRNITQKRGDKTNKDSYTTASLSYSYVIRGKSSFYRGRYGHFFSKKRRGKVRTIRAKF